MKRLFKTSKALGLSFEDELVPALSKNSRWWLKSRNHKRLSFWFDVSENRAVGENFEKLDETVSTLDRGSLSLSSKARRRCLRAIVSMRMKCAWRYL